MYRPKDAVDSLFGLIGWRKDYDPAGEFLSGSLQASDTGQYYQDFHPLLTLSNLKAVAPEAVQATHPTWNVASPYSAGDVVSLDGVDYECLIANTGFSPVGGSNYWERTSQFALWLKEKTRAAIASALRKLWAGKLAEVSAKSLLEQKYLFNGTGRMTDTVTNLGRLVGFELVPLRADGVTVRIHRIGFQATGVTPLRLYLMHSSREDPVQEFDLQYQRLGSIQWFDVDAYLPYASADTDAGGSWYLAYRQEELAEGVEAIRKDRDWSKSPNGSCCAKDMQAYTVWSRHLEVHPFYVSAGNLTDMPDFNDDFNDDFLTAGVSLWDVSQNTYEYSTNYGLNLQISVECDPTQIFADNRLLLQNLIGLQVAADLLREMAYNANARINHKEQNVAAMQILYELDGDSASHKKSGIVHQLETEAKGLTLSMDSMSRACFSCGRRGVKYRTV